MRRFTQQDQERFARLSGDWNPMHMDAVAARRTQAGAPVVHGVHLLLWTLETLIGSGAIQREIASVHAVFHKFVYLDTPAEIRATGDSATSIQAVITAAGVDTTNIEIGFSKAPPPEYGLADQPSVGTQGREANAPDLSAMAEQAGWIDPEGTSDLFPGLSCMLGERRVGAIALTSRLVGMLYPGLHSVYGSLDFSIADDHPRPGLGFHVTMANVRTRLVRLAVAGSGISGTAIAFARREAVVQPSMADVAPHVDRDRFAGALALVTGGSRGLGALTARILALGGARVILTYAQGRGDAEALSAEIDGFVGSAVCSVQHYDAKDNVGLATDGVTHLYHFASPRIYRQKAGLFDAAVFAEFAQTYLRAFHDLCADLQSRATGRMVAFYPSSVFVAPGRPRDMTEYAMIKAAGEVLSEEMSATPGFPLVIARRLPRMLTDQTATLARLPTADALTTLLPVVYEVQAAVTS